MNLSVEQRLMLLKIINDVEEGSIEVPRIGGPIGRFLRELALVQTRVRELVPDDGNFVRGRSVGPISLTPFGPLSESMGSELLGEVASTIAFSEELGGVVNVTLWGKARSANRLRNVWLRSATTVRLCGDFRWFAPRRITPGTALPEELAGPANRWDARCLKFMAEEFLAAPPAVSYRWDRLFGPSDFRTFRVAALYEMSGEWAVVPCREEHLSRPLIALWPSANTAGDARVSGLALATLVRGPWEDGWTVADAQRVDSDGVLAHMITWADHRRELLGLPSPTSPELSALQRILSSIGYATRREGGLERANLIRTISPAAKPLAAWTRGLA